MAILDNEDIQNITNIIKSQLSHMLPRPALRGTETEITFWPNNMVVVPNYVCGDPPAPGIAFLGQTSLAGYKVQDDLWTVEDLSGYITVHTGGMSAGNSHIAIVAGNDLLLMGSNNERDVITGATGIYPSGIYSNPAISETDDVVCLIQGSTLWKWHISTKTFMEQLSLYQTNPGDTEVKSQMCIIKDHYIWAILTISNNRYLGRIDPTTGQVVSAIDLTNYLGGSCLAIFKIINNKCFIVCNNSYYVLVVDIVSGEIVKHYIKPGHPGSYTIGVSEIWNDNIAVLCYTDENSFTEGAEIWLTIFNAAGTPIIDYKLDNNYFYPLFKVQDIPWSQMVFRNVQVTSNTREIGLYIITGNTTSNLRFTELRLPIINTTQEQSVSGSTDWTSAEREQIRNALGINGTKTDATGGQLQTIQNTLTGNLATGVLQSMVTVTNSDMQTIIRGDVKTLTFNLGAQWNLTGKKVYFTAKKNKSAANSTAIVNRECTVTDAANGVVTITLTTTESAVIGTYHAEVEVRNSDESNPNTAMQFILKIIQDIRQ